MSDDEDSDINYEKTHSVIIDYYEMLKQAKWTTYAVIGSSIIIMLATYAIFANSLVVKPESEIDRSLIILFYGTILGIGIGLPITCGDLFLKIILRGREKEKALLNVRNKLIHRSYVMNFEIVNSEGTLQLEKIFNHLSLVFPEIREIRDVWKKKGTSVSEFNKKQRILKSLILLHNFDLVLQTKTGVFIVKIFDKTVTYDDIEKIVKLLNVHQISFKLFAPRIINRVIILANSYDKFFDTTEFIEKVKDLPRKFNLDLILEEDEYGYATVWID